MDEPGQNEDEAGVRQRLQALQVVALPRPAHGQVRIGGRRYARYSEKQGGNERHQAKITGPSVPAGSTCPLRD